MKFEVWIYGITDLRIFWTFRKSYFLPPTSVLSDFLGIFALLNVRYINNNKKIEVICF